MAQRQKDVPPATASGVIRIAGPLEDDVITSIIATGATEAEVLEAVKWFTADDDLGTEVQRTRSGRVAQVYDILAAESQVGEDWTSRCRILSDICGAIVPVHRRAAQPDDRQRRHRSVLVIGNSLRLRALRL